MEARQVLENIEDPTTPNISCPSVVIIGRPNVGKSTLFNRLTETRRALVADIPGLTRDRIYGRVLWTGYEFEIVDTGGIIPDDEAEIPINILRQARVAIDKASLILMLVDARAGITSLDEELAGLLRGLGKPTFVVANKTDAQKIESHAAEFYSLGFKEVFAISAEHGNGTGELLDEVVKLLPFPEKEQQKVKEVKIAIIGRPNVGKSSLVNRLLGENRVIVSPVAGTTRDAIDTVLEHDSNRFRIIDTAGIRRKGKTIEGPEKLSVVMARKSIEQADVAFLLLDSVEGATALDANIAGYAHEAGCSVVIVVNKWDLIEKDTYTAIEYEKNLREKMKYLDYAPVIFISALTGQRVIKLLDIAARAYQARNSRITTAELNRFFESNLAQPRASTPSKSQLKVRYITQGGIAPPTFVVFTNTTQKRLHFSYERYIENRLREEFGFFATPIKIKEKAKTISK
ncbi:MAG: GTP-binding protein [bacterium]|nr:MAG: GTP-binding protein [bacterium]